MRKQILTVLFLALVIPALSQSDPDTSWKTLYRESSPKINDLVDTKLKVSFDLDHSQMQGEEWITLVPHFYPTDSLNLDAKAMDIQAVYLVTSAGSRPLTYHYDGLNLRIQLGKIYKAGEKYKVHIKYISKPTEAKVREDARGLYFINPKGEDKTMPTEIWTDGETNHTSVWCPTIDHPNQKTTEEITMTVPKQLVTLSNGKLISSKINKDGTRTDDWKMELPIAPYLFFMGAGPYSVVKDTYHGKEVNYYVEAAYEPTARRIFGNTPAMIAFYEQITGVPYPWVKYSQIVCRNFTSGAMENVTTTAHAEGAQQDARELVDGNRWESTIAHELFHHWFGDLVTCESWSNLTLNESFAQYSQYLWKEHAYGQDQARAETYNSYSAYLNNKEDQTKDLVRFYYEDQEDMFDGVSYGKGGLILHMLRTYLGDSAFFKGLHLYLVTNKFKSAEAHQLRLALEEVSGQDLNWFFNQWYFGYGNPKVTIDYAYNASTKKIDVAIAQTQGSRHLFKIPVDIDVYAQGGKLTHHIWITQEKEVFTFDCPSAPDLVNVDAQKVILWDKTDNKTIQNYIFQYAHAGNYNDRMEAVTECAKNQSDPQALGLLIKATRDPYYGLRLFTLQKLNMKSDTIRAAVEPILRSLAETDPNHPVRAKAIELLGTYKNKLYRQIFVNNLDDSSYSVAGAALTALEKIDSAAALAEAEKEMFHPMKGKLTLAVTGILTDYGTESQFDYIASKYQAQPFIFPDKLISSINFIHFLSRVHQTQQVKRAIDMIVHFRNQIPGFTEGRINPELSKLASTKDAEGLKEQADYIRKYLPK
jgi:aminopeptidase N